MLTSNDNYSDAFVDVFYLRYIHMYLGKICSCSRTYKAVWTFLYR
jgi:hypothetical protein